MKKLLVLFVFTIFIYGCEKDDSPGTSGDDLIIGVWKPVKDIETIDGVEKVYFSSTCEQKSRITFFTDGDLDVLFYDVDDISGNCVAGDDGYINGSWEKVSGGNYKITTTYFDDDSQQNETDSGIISISFPDSNTMRINYDAGDDDGDGYSEYSRVQ